LCPDRKINTFLTLRQSSNRCPPAAKPILS
jgi:hypothetical protein